MTKTIFIFELVHIDITYIISIGINGVIGFSGLIDNYSRQGIKPSASGR